MEVTCEPVSKPVIEPWAVAVPKLRTVPFRSAIQAPVPPGVTAIPTTGDVALTGENVGSRRASPKLNTVPFESTSQYPPLSGVAAAGRMGRPGVPAFAEP